MIGCITLLCGILENADYCFKNNGKVDFFIGFLFWFLGSKGGPNSGTKHWSFIVLHHPCLVATWSTHLHVETTVIFANPWVCCILSMVLEGFPEWVWFLVYKRTQ